MIDPLDRVAPYTDYIICNESEAAAYAESHELGTTDLIEIAKKVASLPKVNEKKPRTVIFTQGTEATLSVSYNIATKQHSVKEFPVHKLDSTKVTDTNGAGDAFAAGFVAGLVQGKSLDTAVDMGHWLAKLSIQEIGPSYPFPKQTYTN